jgi:hypothetical protein
MDGRESTRLFCKEMLEVIPNQKGTYVRQVEFEDHYKLGSSIKCSL